VTFFLAPVHTYPFLFRNGSFFSGEVENPASDILENDDVTDAGKSHNRTTCFNNLLQHAYDLLL